MKSSDKELARKMKDFRLDRDWTQVQLAAYLNLSSGTIARIEQGYEFTDRTRRKIERLLEQRVEAA
jgi:transcriptional regulator with XRE-family HTH domain